MKKIWMPVLALAFIVGACTTEEKKEEKTTNEKEVVKEEEVKEEVLELMADTQASLINFTGDKVGEEDHKRPGTLKISEGKFTVTNGVVTAGTFTIDMTSATTEFEDLNKHLTEKDMFDIVNFPTATFTITEGSATELKGTLSSIGAEIPVVLAVESTGENTWKASGNVDFAGTNASALQHEEGATKYIDSKIALEITLVAKK